MSLDYTSFVATIATLVPIEVDDPNFVLILPSIIDYAEQRIYRELDLVSTVVNTTGNLTSGNRSVAIPDNMIVLQSMNVVTPAATQPDAGTRNPLQRVSLEYMNFTWPDATMTGVPEQYALLTNALVKLAPTPDAAYVGEFVGTIRPTPLSASNTTTFLTTNLPDLFVAASMVFTSGWMRDFGSQSEDPATAQSWENQYKTLFGSANIEEARRKAMSTAWQPFMVAPLATPPRQ